MPSIDQGELTFVRDTGGRRKGHIGSAPQDVPYWQLFDHSGERWARLCIMFQRECAAIDYMDSWFREGHSEMLQYGIPRQLRSVEILPEAQVLGFRFDAHLWLWCEEIMENRGDRTAPAALVKEDFDVLRVVRSMHPQDYECLIVTEKALAEGRVVCSEGRIVVFRKD